jgi:transposase
MSALPAIAPTASLVPSADQSPDPDELRRQRGLAIAALSRIAQTKPGLWAVPSQSGGGKYWVRCEGETLSCTCPDYEKRSQPCKHVFAVRFFIQRETNSDGSETVTETLTVTRKTTAHRPTYRQNWPAYNAAQVNEKAKFQVLLHDLCRGIAEPPRPPKRGGQPLALTDAVFAAAFKVFSTVSGRRFSCDLSDAYAKGYLSRLPHYNTVFSYLENPALTPILRDLIAQSALPLKSVEVDFAVDSSGFTSSKFVRWMDQKYGVVKQEHDWVKVHVMTGVKTNVVTSVEVGDRHAADSPQFAPLVNATARRFAIGEVSADKAYASYDNMALVAAHGGTPFIAFRANATATKGGIYEKMFHYYSLRRDEFLSHYHKRSNVESTFSMIKAKFGDHLRSKSDVAMVNEALAKVLCHNVVVNIASMYELGINPVFWGEEEQEQAPEPEPAEEPVPMDAWAWV